MNEDLMTSPNEVISKAVNTAYHEKHPEDWYNLIPDEPHEIEAALVLDGLDLRGTDILRTLKWYDEIHELVEAQRDKLQLWERDGNTVDTLRRVFDRYERNASEQYNGVTSFRDRVVTELTAMRLYVTSCMNGATHREKDARLRGLEEIIEQGISRLHNIHRDLFSWSRWPESIFSSNTSEARLQRQVWEMEKQIADYRKQFGKLPQTQSEETDQPF
jgi:hypothetical protein